MKKTVKKTSSAVKEVSPEHKVEDLMKRLKLTNVFAAPRLVKIVVNAGVGKTRKDDKKLEAIKKDLATITGQRPGERSAKKSIAGFTLRQGDLVGYVVTLRGQRMRSFLSRLVNVALPRTRDFQGLSRSSLDGTGNYTIGIKDQTVFSEINPENVSHFFGFEISLVTTAKTNEEGIALFEVLGVPLQKSWFLRNDMIGLAAYFRK